MKFTVIVTRTIREDTVVEVEADDADDAREKGEAEAVNRGPEEWDAFDCDYSFEAYRGG